MSTWEKKQKVTEVNFLTVHFSHLQIQSICFPYQSDISWLVKHYTNQLKVFWVFFGFLVLSSKISANQLLYNVVSHFGQEYLLALTMTSAHLSH